MSVFTVDLERCNRDGICSEVCPLGVIETAGLDEPPSLVPGADQRCIECGHCVAVCPTGAMALKTMGPEDCGPIRNELKVRAEQAEQFFMARRSVRAYQHKPVPRETLKKLIRLASYASAGHNKQFTQWLVIEDRNEIRLLAGLVVEWMRSLLQEQPHLDAILDLKLQGGLVGKRRRMHISRCASSNHRTCVPIPSHHGAVAEVDTDRLHDCLEPCGIGRSLLGSGGLLGRLFHDRCRVLSAH